jgi:hypothetical protein
MKRGPHRYGHDSLVVTSSLTSVTVPAPLPLGPPLRSLQLHAIRGGHSGRLRRQSPRQRDENQARTVVGWWWPHGPAAHGAWAHAAAQLGPGASGEVSPPARAVSRWASRVESNVMSANVSIAGASRPGGRQATHCRRTAIVPSWRSQVSHTGAPASSSHCTCGRLRQPERSCGKPSLPWTRPALRITNPGDVLAADPEGRASRVPDRDRLDARRRSPMRDRARLPDTIPAA